METQTANSSLADAATSANVAAVLNHIADLIEDGLPRPTSVRLYGVPSVLVSYEDLPTWLTALEVVQPYWIADASMPSCEHATWEPGTFDEHPFTLSAVRFVDEAVSA